MVQQSVIEAQLTKLGVRKTFFTRPEIRQLQHILMDHEQVIRCAQGRYHGGFAILVSTEQRLLLVDKKPLYLTVEDIRYDMISEVDISSSLFDATVNIFTVNKQLSFSAFRQRQLRALTSYIQKRVMDFRQYHPETAVAQLPQPGSVWAQAQGQTFPQNATSTTTHQLAAHMPHIPHLPNPVPKVLAHTHPHIPEHFSQAVGSAATKLASRLHNPNPYTKAPLMIRRRWTTWSEPSTKELEVERT